MQGITPKLRSADNQSGVVSPISVLTTHVVREHENSGAQRTDVYSYPKLHSGRCVSYNRAITCRVL